MRWEAASTLSKSMHSLAKYVAGRFQDRELGELVYVRCCDSAFKDKCPHGVFSFFLPLSLVALLQPLGCYPVGVPVIQVALLGLDCKERCYI